MIYSSGKKQSTSILNNFLMVMVISLFHHHFHQKNQRKTEGPLFLCNAHAPGDDQDHGDFQAKGSR